MINSEVCVKIKFDENDGEDISTTILTLQYIREAFEKAGTYNEFEVEALRQAENIVSEIVKGNTF